MKFINLYGSAAAALLLTMVAVAPAHAQASRTWVSGVGDDAQPCSRTAPCKTFAGAISKTAAGGEIDALDPGGFGALTITKAITIDGGGGQVASALFAGTNGFNVSAGVNDVVILRNLRFNGISQSSFAGTNGIQFNSGAALVVEHCDIFDVSNWGINFVPSGTSELHVLDTVISNAGSGANGGGILMMPGSAGMVKASIAGTKVTDSAVGIRADGSSTANPTSVSIENTVSSGSPHSGAVAFTTQGPVTMMIDRLNSNNNNVGVQAVNTGATIYLGNSAISGNGTGTVAANGGSIQSYKTNQINGNTTDGPSLPAVALN